MCGIVGMVGVSAVKISKPKQIVTQQGHVDTYPQPA